MDNAYNQHGIFSEGIQNPVLSMHDLADTSSKLRLGRPGQWMARQQVEHLVKSARILVGNILPERGGAVGIDRYQVGARRSAEFDVSHAGRDVLR